MGTNRILELTGRGELRLRSADGSQFITCRYPAANAGSPVYDLPGTQGAASTFLKNDGTGVLSWAAGSSTLQSAYTSGSTITITGGTPVILDLAAGGEVLRVTEGLTTVRLGAVAAANGDIGTSSNHGFEIRTNAIARITITNAGAVTIPGTLSSGALTVTSGGITVTSGGIIVTASTITLDNNKQYQIKNAAAAVKTVLLITAADRLEIGDSTLTTPVVVRNTGGFGVGLGSVDPVGIVEVGHATASTLVVRTTSAADVAHKSSIFFATSTGAITASNETGEIRVTPTFTAGSLWSKLDFFVNTASSIRNILSIDPWNAGLDPTVNFGFDNGCLTSIQHTVPVLVNMSGASSSASNLLPASSLVIGISYRITTEITGTMTSMSIGVAADTSRFAGSTNAFAAGTTFTSFGNSTGTETAPRIYRTSTGVIFTATGGTFSAGQVRLVAHYIKLTPPTS